jgi:hypothetical protein
VADRPGPAARVLGDLALADHSCASLFATWARAGGGQFPAWRASFTGAGRAGGLARDVPGLLGYRHFLAALAGLLDLSPGPGQAAGEELERQVVARRDELAGADPGGYLRLLLDHAGTAALLVDTGGGDKVLKVAELERAADRPVHQIVRLEPLAEALLAQGAPTSRSLARFLGGFEERVGLAMERGAVALKSIAAHRGGLWLFTESSQADRRRAFTNLDKAAQAARLWPMLRDPRTEECPVVLLGCYPYVGGAAHLAGTYPQVHMDLSPVVALAEPIAARQVSEALGLCPPGKLLAGSGGRAYPESHWWGATVWRRALARILRAEVAAGGLDEAAARDTARRILATNATRLYRL